MPKRPRRTNSWAEQLAIYAPQAMALQPGGNVAPVLSSKRPTIGQRIAQAASRKVTKTPAKATPLERMNQLHPGIRLHSLPDSFPNRDLFGEPDVVVCLEYYRRLLATAESKDEDEPVSILLEFLQKHPMEFECSGWVVPVVGSLVLGHPNYRERRAKKLFLGYWRQINSPKGTKAVVRSMQMFRATKLLDSPHAAHWRGLVRWMQKAEARGRRVPKWFDEYAASHPARCACLNERSFQSLLKAYVKLRKRPEDAASASPPPPSVVVLEAIAVGHRVASRDLAQYRADAKKRAGKMQ